MQRHHAHLLLVLAAADALLGLTPSNSPRARAADRLDSATKSLETFKPSEVFQGGFHDNDKAVRRARRRAQDRVAVAYHAAKSARASRRPSIPRTRTLLMSRISSGARALS